jgi:hypothetical protein
LSIELERKLVVTPTGRTRFKHIRFYKGVETLGGNMSGTSNTFDFIRGWKHWVGTLVGKKVWSVRRK